MNVSTIKYKLCPWDQRKSNHERRPILGNPRISGRGQAATASCSEPMIAPEVLLTSVREALAAIAQPRFFDTERGYQGQLLVELGARLQLPNAAIVEQEYQKQAQMHGLNIRPDIIIHEPFDPERHHTRADGNFAVMELKRRASSADARDDFRSLAQMLDVLRYRLGIFINIDSRMTHSKLVPADLHGRVACFAVILTNEVPEIVEHRI